MSTRSFTSENLSSQQLLEVLRFAYGYVNGCRSTPIIGYDYSLIVFPVNATGSYRYFPEDGSLALHQPTVNKETIRPHDQGWPSDSSVVLVVVWNSTKMDNEYFTSAEAGCLVQNVYLAAAHLELGTCCVGSIDSYGLRDDLQLVSDLAPLLVMPVGYRTEPYPPASPHYDKMIGNLPVVQYSQFSFEESVDSVITAQSWSAENLSSQELSQLLWSAYGYTNTTHRTTPSAWGVYPLEIYASNSSGVYLYLPNNHSVVEIQHGDKRLEIADACSGQTWAAEAAAIFTVVYNSSYNDGNTGDGGILPHEFIEVNTGAVIQQLLLEASAWNLSVNVVSEGLSQWNGTGAQDIRGILDLSSSLVPLYIIPIGHKSEVEGHDVAITNIYPTKTAVGEGYSLHVNTAVKNKGLFEESLNLTLYANSTLINSTISNLSSGQSMIFTFSWDTTGLAKGDYRLQALVLPVQNETYIENNNLTDGWVTITIPGDVDGDRDVDIYDIVLLAGSYGSVKGQPLFISNCDIDNDFDIDIYDVVIAAGHYGKSWQP